VLGMDPLSRPALISAGLILFVFRWQAFLWPLLIAPDPDYKVAAVAIADFAGEHSADFGAMFAGTIFVSFVPLIILLVFQNTLHLRLPRPGVRNRAVEVGSKNWILFG
jgi:putative chitobiose transport system permease protein